MEGGGGMGWGGGWMGWMGEEMGNGKWEMGEGGGLVEGGNKGDGEVVGWEEVKGGLENDEWRMVG